MFATALALLSSAFVGKDRGTAFGIFGATTGVAVAIGPVLGGVLTSGLSWRWIFWVNIPICVLAITVAMRKVDESSDPNAGRPDWFGFVTFSSWSRPAGLRPDRGRVPSGGATTAWSGAWSRSAVLLVVFIVTQLRPEAADVRPRVAAQTDVHGGLDRGVRASRPRSSRC